MELDYSERLILIGLDGIELYWIGFDRIGLWFNQIVFNCT